MSELSYAPIASVPVSDSFFDTFRADHPGVDDWFRRKAGEPGYIARRDGGGLDGLPYQKIGRLWRFKLSEVDEWVRAGGAEGGEMPTSKTKTAKAKRGRS